MALEQLIKLPYREFSQWENGRELHQAEYEAYSSPELSERGLIILKKVPGSEMVIHTDKVIPEGYRNSFREEIK